MPTLTMSKALRLRLLLSFAFVCSSQAQETAVAPPAPSQSVSYDVLVDSEGRRASVATTVENGVRYCPLPDLIRQLGGGYSLSWGKARVDYRGSSAWIPVNGRKVNASFAEFELTHPLVRRGQEDVLIAIDDVKLLMSKAFRVETTLTGFPESAAAMIGDETDPALEFMSVLGAGDLGMVSEGLDGAGPLSWPEDEAVESAVKPVVIIDPGHGGYDKGAVGKGGLQEKDLALTLGLSVEELLSASGLVEVHTTRQDDGGLSLEDRGKFIGENGGTLLVSIHAGESRAVAAQGFELYYQGTWPPGTEAALEARQSRVLATHMAQAFAQATAAEHRGIRAMPWPLGQQAGLPAVLIEVGCLSTESQEAQLSDGAYVMRAAQGIADGVTAYLASREEPEEPETLAPRVFAPPGFNVGNFPEGVWPE